MNDLFVSIDIESTGLDPVRDRIVQFAAVCYEGWPSQHNEVTPTCLLVNPGIPIPAEATAVHGITDADVAAMGPFKSMAQEILDLLYGRTVIGFNLFGLDLPILCEEFERAGVEWNWRQHQFIDAGNLFKLREPRTLSAAVKFYLGFEYEEAHDALSDATATADVLSAQIARYTDLASMSIEALAKATRHPERQEIIDLAGKFGRNAKGEIVYCFGKSKGVPVKSDPGIARWMLGKDFPVETQRVAMAILDGRMT